MQDLENHAYQFQSTLPSQGATDLPEGIASVLDISIHAPLTGSDSADLELFLHNEYFNPRSPHRERPSSRFTLSIMRYFNPRSPHRERRLFWVICWVFSRFQSTLPSQGATISQSFMYSKINISIHAPLTGSDHDLTIPINSVSTISIHAPLTGSDFRGSVTPTHTRHFNPRSPHRERRLMTWDC